MGIIEEILEEADLGQTPLFSVFDWIISARRIPLTLGGFLSIVQELIGSGQLELIKFDSQVGREVVLDHVPATTKEDYLALLPELDGRYDPLGLSIRRSGSQDCTDWTLDIDVAVGRFELVVRHGNPEETLERVSGLLDGVQLVELEKRESSRGVLVLGITLPRRAGRAK